MINYPKGIIKPKPVPKPKRVKVVRTKSAVEKQSSLERTFDTLATLYGITGYEHQYRFHDIRGWLMDIAWPAKKIAIEIQGETNHARYHRLTEDAHKNNAAVIAGWRVLYVTGEMLKRDPASFFTLLKELL